LVWQVVNVNQVRVSMRPVTLKRIIEVCNLALSNKMVDETLIIQKLKTSSERAKELLFEIERIKVLERGVGGFVANDNTLTIMDAFEREDWQVFHEYLIQNYSFYQQFIELLGAHINDEKGLSISEMIEEAKIKKLQLNQTAIEVLQNWCERLGMLQRHLYTKRFYLLKKEKPDSIQFENAVKGSYRILNTARGLGLKLMYVEIPRLREEVCEKLKILRETFDVLFKKLYYKSIGRMELSGAPMITAAKKSPLSIRMIKTSKKEDILAPYLDLAKERKGVEIGGKSYYYVAMHQEAR